MDKEEFIRYMQKRTAQSAVGPSTARGMGPEGTVEAARNYLANLDLSCFNVNSEKEFTKVLNKRTRYYMKQLPKGAQNWGAARKFMNIFLRDVIYNRYLCRHFKLRQIEPWLEIPLDSHVAKKLCKEPEGQYLPRWKTVIGLERKTSDQYQDAAKRVGRRKGISRVHLDLLYWRSE